MTKDRTTSKRKSQPDQETLNKEANLSEALPPKTSEFVGTRAMKRKLREKGEVLPGMGIEKRRRFDLGEEMPCCSRDIVKESSNAPGMDVSRRNGKRKAEFDEEEPRKKQRKTQDLDEKKTEAMTGTKMEKRKEKRKNLTEKKDDIKKKAEKETQPTLSVEDQRAKFMAKYQERKQLGEGGCGSVFAGYRKADNLPVAIKHIERKKIYCKHVDEEGKCVSIEVAIMLKLAADARESGEKPAAISLLDWYDLGQELILVLERPVPSKDLLNYIEDKGGALNEQEAKIIMKQLVEATVELQDKNIFHRDIKLDNILIETQSKIPRVRLIDFGLGCFVKKGSAYRVFYGASAHTPPEWYITKIYKPGPTTVWQLGGVLYEILHRKPSFETKRLLRNKLKIHKKLSPDCQDFLRKCLAIDPQRRGTLEELQHHPWLR